MSQEAVVGIYYIENLINHKKYYGSSININERLLEHKRLLKLNQHQNSHLQNSFNQYGEENFVFKPFIQIDSFGYSIEQIKDLILSLEQTCINFFDSTNRKNGYNQAKLTLGGASHFSEKDLENGRCKINKDQFNQIISLLQNDRKSYREIGEIVGVENWYIKQIAERKILTELTKDISFPPRYNYGNKMRAKFKKDIVYYRDIENKTFNEISKIIGITEFWVRRIYYYEDIPNTGLCRKVYQFNLQGQYLNEYKSAQEASIATKNPRRLITDACRRVLKFGKSGDFLWSYLSEIPEMSIPEQIVGEKFTSVVHPIVGYNDKKEPCVFFKTHQDACKYEQFTAVQLRTAIEKNKNLNNKYWKEIEDVPEKDLLFLLNKNIL